MCEIQILEESEKESLMDMSLDWTQVTQILTNQKKKKKSIQTHTFMYNKLIIQQNKIVLFVSFPWLNDCSNWLKHLSHATLKSYKKDSAPPLGPKD